MSDYRLDSTVTIQIEEQPSGFYVITGYSDRTGETWYACGRSLNCAGLVVEGCTVGEIITHDPRATCSHRRGDAIDQFRTQERDQVREARADKDCPVCYGEGWKYRCGNGDLPDYETVACDCCDRDARPGAAPTP